MGFSRGGDVFSGLDVERGVDVTDEVADIGAAVEESDDGLDGCVFGSVIVAVDGVVPLGPEGFEGVLRFVEHGGELGAGGFQLGAGFGVVATHLEFFEGHVELEGFFEEVGWGYLFFLRAGGFGEVCGGARLLF